MEAIPPMEKSSFIPKILVVDDQEKNLYSMNAILKSLNAQIHLAYSGREALAQIIRHEYAVILLDVQMPDIDGYDTAKIIRANHGSRTTPIIFVTANSITKSNIDKGYESGAVEYLCKPIESKILLSKVQIFLDIYNEKHEKERLNQLLNHKNAELMEFTRIVSHDLKEPLRGILFNIGLLSQTLEQKLNQEEQEQLDRIRYLATHLQELITSLLNYSHVGHSNESFKNISISDVITSLTLSLQMLIVEKNAIIDINPDLPSVYGNRAQIEELFRNFITNALKYNTSDSPKIEIGFEMSKRKTPVYYVKDNGIGIPDKHKNKVFKIFTHLHPKGKYGEGTGIGLSIVRKIIDLHQGSVWVDSREGQGSTFYFTIGENSGRVS